MRSSRLLLAVLISLLALGIAQQASAARPRACSFQLSALALTDGQRAQLSLGLDSRSACAAPRTLRSVQVFTAEKPLESLSKVAAPGGQATVDLGRLRSRARVRVSVRVAAYGRIYELAAQTLVRLRPDLVVRRLHAPVQGLSGHPFTVTAKIAEPTGGVATTASVVVVQGETTVASTTVLVRPGRPGLVSVPVTLPSVGSFPLTLRIVSASPAETNTTNNDAATSIEVSEFQLTAATVLVPSLAGYGAQLNQNVYAQLSRDAGVTDENVVDMEQKLLGLAPGLVRVFFAPAAYSNPDLMQSFLRTMQLAQRSGATINVTWQGGTLDVPRFGALLVDMVKNQGITQLRWVTLQNEVNSTRITMDTYERLYRELDGYLTQAGVRQQIRFMGGDLVAAASPLGQTQADWLNFLATRMADVLDAWSIHVFWSYSDPGRFATRLQDVRAIVDRLPADARKPLYITEYGVRGQRNLNGTPYPDPGVWDDGTPIGQTAVGAFQQAWFDVLAARLGFAGAIKWDGYFGRYDRGTQDYSLIGPPQQGWPLRPVYFSLRLFTETTRPGWKIVSVDGGSGTKLLTGYVGPGGEVTVVGLDTSGGTLNVVSPTQVSYNVGGLPANATLRLELWNPDGTGVLGAGGPVQSDAAGVATVTAPQHAIFALTTLPS